MAYVIVKTLKCITNKKLDNDETVNLTIGRIYQSTYSNSTPESKSFGLFDDNGTFTEFNKRFFKVYETYTRNDTGWEIHCKDCRTELNIEDIKKNDYKCPKCGQAFNI